MGATMNTHLYRVQTYSLPHKREYSHMHTNAQPTVHTHTNSLTHLLTHSLIHSHTRTLLYVSFADSWIGWYVSSKVLLVIGGIRLTFDRAL